MTDRTNSFDIRGPIQKMAVALGVFLLGACAQSPEDIAPAYVSEMQFKDWACGQLTQEKGRLAMALTTASAQQELARANDIAGIILLGLPVASISGSNIAPQIARLKGERDAVDRALILNDCTGAVAAVGSSAPWTAPETSTGTAAPEPEAAACGPVAGDPASRPELKAALARYYKRNPLQRAYNLRPVRLQSIEKLTVAEISGNLLTVKVQYRARRVHWGVAKVEACGSNFKVLSFT